MYKEENIFKLSNGYYLLKYILIKFRTLLEEKEWNIINVILNNSLNKIIIITLDNISFIYIFHLESMNLTDFYDEKNSENIKIKNTNLNNYDPGRYYNDLTNSDI